MAVSNSGDVYRALRVASQHYDSDLLAAQTQRIADMAKRIADLEAENASLRRGEGSMMPIVDLFLEHCGVAHIDVSRHYRRIIGGFGSVMKFLDRSRFADEFREDIEEMRATSEAIRLRLNANRENVNPSLM